MLKWLWNPDAEHGADERFLRVLLNHVRVNDQLSECPRAEVLIDLPHRNRWRLADIVLSTPGYLVLVEVKVDPGYQDHQQILDEIDGGRRLANTEGREFVYVLIAPGPLQSHIATTVNTAGHFLNWGDLVAMLRDVPVDDLGDFVQAIVGQYFNFMGRPAGQRAADDTVLWQCEEVLTQLIVEVSIGAEVTALELWDAFVVHFPDHATALDDRYAESSHYPAKAWFIAMLQQWAASRRGVEDTGEWRKVDGAFGGTRRFASTIGWRAEKARHFPESARNSSCGSQPSRRSP